jgi:hypothetical protein
MKVPGIIGIIMIIPIIFKWYYIIKIEQFGRSFHLFRATFRWLFWIFPVIQRPENHKQKVVIRRANIATGAFWSMFFLLMLVLLIIAVFE